MLRLFRRQRLLLSSLELPFKALTFFLVAAQTWDNAIFKSVKASGDESAGIEIHAPTIAGNSAKVFTSKSGLPGSRSGR